MARLLVSARAGEYASRFSPAVRDAERGTDVTFQVKLKMAAGTVSSRGDSLPVGS